LANHVVGQEFRFAHILGGGSLDDYIATRDHDFVGDDPVAAWGAGVRLLDQVIDRFGALDTVIEWRWPMPARDLLAVRLLEAAVHTWDLSRAIGFDERLDERLLETFERLFNDPVFSAWFQAPKGSLAPDLSAQERLLRLAGPEP
jgi:uncharacterized protein (TIGR03086 family)